MDRAMPPNFRADMQKAQELEERRQHDPLATIPMVQLYTQMLGRLQPNMSPSFYADIQDNLGTAYRDLPTGDPTANLKRAIACYQEALRIPWAFFLHFTALWDVC